MQKENQGVALSPQALRVHLAIRRQEALDLHPNLPLAAINPQVFPLHQNPQEAVPQRAALEAPLTHLQEDINLEVFQIQHQAVEAILPAVKATAAPSEALYLYLFLGAHTEVMATHLMLAIAALVL